MLSWWLEDCKNLSFRFYFTNFICKEIGIKYLYIFESDFHDFITSENPKPMNKD